jgi:predicted cation transporter
MSEQTTQAAPTQAEPLVVNVAEAGAMAGLSKVRAYAAAKDGSMPTIVVAGRMKVPLKAWKAKLNGEPA